jgi:hypothetical protein
MHALGCTYCWCCSQHQCSYSEFNRRWHIAVRNVLLQAGDYACKAPQWRYGKRAVAYLFAKHMHDTDLTRRCFSDLVEYTWFFRGQTHFFSGANERAEIEMHNCYVHQTNAMVPYLLDSKVKCICEVYTARNSAHCAWNTVNAFSSLWSMIQKVSCMQGALQSSTSGPRGMLCLV